MYKNKNGRPRRPTSFLRKLGKAILILIGSLVAIVALLVLYLTTPYFTASLGTFFTHKSGRHVALEGKLEMHLFQSEPQFIISGVKIGNAEWASTPLMFQADRIEVAIRPWELLKGQLVIAELNLTHPVIDLEKNDKGDANWEFGSNPQAQVVKKPLPDSRSNVPILNHLSISDGELAYKDPKSKIDTDLKISTVMGSMGSDNASSDAIQVHGKGTYQTAPFALDVTAASILELKDSAKPFPFSIHTTIGRTHADVEGTVVDPVKMESFDVTLNLKGANFADLYPITGIALPPSPPYDIHGHLTRTGDDWKVDNMHGQLGTSDLKGSIVWHPALKPPYFEGNLVSDNLDMKDLAGLVGGDSKPADPDRVIPDTPLDISRLMAMNADVSFKGRKVKAPNLLSDFNMNISLKDGTLMLHPVSFGIAESSINANITIEGKKTPPQVALDVEFKKLSLHDLFEPIAKSLGKKNVNEGLLGGKIELKGEGKSLRDILATSNGNIGMGMDGGTLSDLLLNLAGLDILRSGSLFVSSDEPVPMKCVVGDFGITNGQMDTRALLISTNVTNIRGKGNISLRDESMDMHMYVYPDKATILSARSPLYIKGTFKKPSAGVDATALAARGGIAALLGTFLTPPAALLAFIEPGLGSKSNCAEVISKMDTDLKTTKIIPAPAKSGKNASKSVKAN